MLKKKINLNEDFVWVFKSEENNINHKKFYLNMIEYPQ